LSFFSSHHQDMRTSNRTHILLVYFSTCVFHFFCFHFIFTYEKLRLQCACKRTQTMVYVVGVLYIFLILGSVSSVIDIINII
jgi:hypothetical protein